MSGWSVMPIAGMGESPLAIDRRDGRETHYSANPQGLTPLTDWLSLYGAFWRKRFDRLENLLKRIDE